MLTVMLEEVTWPPEGVLEWLLSECLLLKLYTENEAEQTKAWSNDHMHTLLMRIAYSVAPEVDLIGQGSEISRILNS